MLLLVGAGGHAKAIVEALEAVNLSVDAYVDPVRRDWLSAEHITSDEVARSRPAGDVVMGLGGVKPGDLLRRLCLLDAYLSDAWVGPSVVHPAATISKSAKIGAGAIVLAGAVVQPAARIGDAAVVNTGAIVEHDSIVGRGAHVGPGATVLGDCTIGQGAMIGAGAMILPSANVPDESLVPALTVYPDRS